MREVAEVLQHEFSMTETIRDEFQQQGPLLLEKRGESNLVIFFFNQTFVLHPAELLMFSRR